MKKPRKGNGFSKERFRFLGTDVQRLQHVFQCFLGVRRAGLGVLHDLSVGTEDVVVERYRELGVELPDPGVIDLCRCLVRLLGVVVLPDGYAELAV